ncbi:MAG: endolytic transglycosylase MltG [Acidimicrobiia bacterium]|nr:endolytic transglycosylase MltG [Acidimicrobiia bacterium]
MDDEAGFVDDDVYVPAGDELVGRGGRGGRRACWRWSVSSPGSWSWCWAARRSGCGARSIPASRVTRSPSTSPRERPRVGSPASSRTRASSPTPRSSGSTCATRGPGRSRRGSTTVSAATTRWATWWPGSRRGRCHPSRAPSRSPRGCASARSANCSSTRSEGTDPAELDAALDQVTSRYLPSEDTSLEGFLFPDTYELAEEDAGNELALVTRLVEEFDRVATELGYGEPNPFGLSAYELVIVASLIEEEARVPEDRTKISRVIHNRLEQGMTLGIDAALLYELGHTDSLTQSQLETDSPYNTRLNAGLPPTPIAMPGRGSLEAALNPAEGDWLYYVLADESGAHFFTSDYDEFLAQKQASQDAGLF